MSLVQRKENLQKFFSKFNEISSKDMMERVEEWLDDECIEVIVSHLEDFYGIDDDEELGSLAQIMITGFLAAKFDSESSTSIH
jgi:archaellum component FlaC